MKKAALYSSSASSRVPPPEPELLVPDEPRLPWRTRMANLFRRRERLILFFGSALIAVVPALIVWQGQTPVPELQQDEIDSAVLHTLETQSLPSRPAKAAELVRQSVVRVRGYVDLKDVEEDVDKAKSGGKDGAKGKSKGAGKDSAKDARKSGKDSAKNSAKGGNAKGSARKGAPKPDSTDTPKEDHDPDDKAKDGERLASTGSGVVILENGTILTNLHVVAGAKRLTVTFYDGMESEAVIVGLHPENDLAVIRAKKIPDDLPPATMGAKPEKRGVFGRMFGR